MKRTKPIIAIDGPVGSGKSTTAKKVAERLGFIYVDTGAMYRAITLDVLSHGVDVTDEEQVRPIVAHSHVELKIDRNIQRTYLNGLDVSDRIRDLDVTRAVSAVSAMKCVREKMTSLQRELGKHGGVVMEGRDIGTVVFPDAEYKFYLDASLDVRVERRFKELIAKGIMINLDELRKEIAERDRANIERALAPLRKAPDAEVIDTTNMTIDEQVTAIIGRVAEGY